MERLRGTLKEIAKLGYPIERRYHGGWRTAVLFDIGYPLLVFCLGFCFGCLIPLGLMISGHSLMNFIL